MDWSNLLIWVFYLRGPLYSFTLSNHNQRCVDVTTMLNLGGKPTNKREGWIIPAGGINTVDYFYFTIWRHLECFIISWSWVLRSSLWSLQLLGQHHYRILPPQHLTHRSYYVDIANIKKTDWMYLGCFSKKVAVFLQNQMLDRRRERTTPVSFHLWEECPIPEMWESVRWHS